MLILLRLIHNVCYHVLHERKRKEKSPIGGDFNPEPHPQLQPNVNPILELVKVSHELFEYACIILWDFIIFGVDNGNIQFYIVMHDVFEIIQGNQLLNIAIIQLWVV